MKSYCSKISFGCLAFIVLFELVCSAKLGPIASIPKSSSSSEESFEIEFEGSGDDGDIRSPQLPSLPVPQLPVIPQLPLPGLPQLPLPGMGQGQQGGLPSLPGMGPQSGMPSIPPFPGMNPVSIPPMPGMGQQSTLSQNQLQGDTGTGLPALGNGLIPLPTIPETSSGSGALPNLPGLPPLPALPVPQLPGLGASKNSTSNDTNSAKDQEKVIGLEENGNKVIPPKFLTGIEAGGQETFSNENQSFEVSSFDPTERIKPHQKPISSGQMSSNFCFFPGFCMGKK